MLIRLSSWSNISKGAVALSITMLMNVAAQAQSPARMIDRPEMAVSITPGFDFESGSKGHPLVLEPAFTMIYQGIMFSAAPSFGFGKAQSAFKYNAKGFIPEGGKFTQERLELQVGYALNQQLGRIIPYFGMSGMRLGYKTNAGDHKSLQLLPNYTIGVSGIFDLAKRFHMETVIGDHIVLRHYVHLRLAYTFVDPSTTGQRKTDLPNGIFGLGIGWGAFFAPDRD